MRAVLLGGAPGVGKSTVARHFLDIAAGGTDFVQWIDIDALWLHQPWRVDEQTTGMMWANLSAVIGNAAAARVDVLLITWVFQTVELRERVRNLLPADGATISVQLLADRRTWGRRFEDDPTRTGVNEFYWGRYEAAQAMTADHYLDTDHLAPLDVARRLADLLAPPGN